VIRYLDSDWGERDDPGVPAIVVDNDGIRWNDAPPIAIPVERRDDPDSIAAAALHAVAAEAVARVPEGSGPVEVLGQGLVAAEARRLLPAGTGNGDRPRCVIDATGDPEKIVAALGELDDLGTLVAAGPLGARSFPINLYQDIHLRGLKVVGVAPPLANGRLPEPADAPPLGTGQWFRTEA